MRKLILIALLLTSFATSPSYGQADHRHLPVSAAAPISAEQQSLWTRYEEAVFDSAVYQRWNVRTLRPLTPDENGEVLLATLTWRDYKAGTSFTPERDI